MAKGKSLSFQVAPANAVAAMSPAPAPPRDPVTSNREIARGNSGAARAGRGNRASPERPSAAAASLHTGEAPQPTPEVAGVPRLALQVGSRTTEATPEQKPRRPTTSAHRKITVLIAEDHAVVREGLSALLRLEGGFTVVGEARTGREAVSMAIQLKPDVVLMDVAMPTLNGILATRQIVTNSHHIRVLILSAHCDDEYVERAYAAGASGFVEKQMTSEVLASAIREVAAGKTFFSPNVAEQVRDGLGGPGRHNGILKGHGSRLTTRELEVLQLVAEGLANKQVSANLGISIKTVEKHRQNIMDKLNIHETAGLTRYAITSGVIENRSQPTVQ